MTPFTKHVIEIIQRIPSGKVMTYGQIAKWAGSPRAARQVVRILHSMSKKHHLPWHRVVNRHGQIAIKEEEHFEEQIAMLESEGVEVSVRGTVNLDKYLWTGEAPNGENCFI